MWIVLLQLFLQFGGATSGRGSRRWKSSVADSYSLGKYQWLFIIPRKTIFLWFPPAIPTNFHWLSWTHALIARAAEVSWVFKARLERSLGSWTHFFCCLAWNNITRPSLHWTCLKYTFWFLHIEAAEYVSQRESLPCFAMSVFLLASWKIKSIYLIFIEKLIFSIIYFDSLNKLEFISIQISTPSPYESMKKRNNRRSISWMFKISSLFFLNRSNVMSNRS